MTEEDDGTMNDRELAAWNAAIKACVEEANRQAGYCVDERLRDKSKTAEADAAHGAAIGIAIEIGKLKRQWGTYRYWKDDE